MTATASQETQGINPILQLHISASSLPKKKPTTFVLISKRETAEVPWIELCRTETVFKSANPEYPTTIDVEFRFETAGDIKFDILVGEHTTTDVENCKLLGTHETQISSVSMGDLTGQLKDSFGRLTQATITIRSRVLEENLDMLDFQFAGSNLDRKNYLGLGKSDPFYEIYQVVDRTEVKIFTSEKIVANLNPQWEPQRIPIQALCGGNLRAKIVIRVFDWKSHGDHYFIGLCRTSVQKMLQDEEYTLLGKSGKVAGKLTLNFCQVRKQYSFMKYIQGGLDINLCIGIDFTQSNGPIDSPNCLHKLDTGGENEITMFNEYQKAILSMGQILERFDTDKKIPVYGLGGIYRGEKSDCFPLTSRINAEVDGIDGVLDAYQDAVKNVGFSSPCKFSPMLDEIIRLAKESIDAGQHKYFVLLLLTAGQINDMDQTLRLLCEAASLPISLVIAGIGDGDFANMDVLDGDNKRISWNGMEAERDIVQFVPVNEYTGRSYTTLAEATLEELPRQVTNYFGSRNVAPMTPVLEAQTHYNELHDMTFADDVVPMAEEIIED